MSSARDTVFAFLPGTADEIAARAGISLAGAYRGLNRLKTEENLHVSGWRVVKGQGRVAAVYTAGPGVDAPHPGVAQPKPSRNRPPTERRKSARPFGAATASLAGGLFR